MHIVRIDLEISELRNGQAGRRAAADGHGGGGGRGDGRTSTGAHRKRRQGQPGNRHGGDLVVEPREMLLHEGALFAEFFETVGHGEGEVGCPLNPAQCRT